MSVNSKPFTYPSICYLTRICNRHLKLNMEKWSSLIPTSPIVFFILVNGNSFFRDDSIKNLEAYFLMLFFLFTTCQLNYENTSSILTSSPFFSAMSPPLPTFFAEAWWPLFSTLSRPFFTQQAKWSPRHQAGHSTAPFKILESLLILLKSKKPESLQWPTRPFMIIKLFFCILYKLMYICRIINNMYGGINT